MTRICFLSFLWTSFSLVAYAVDPVVKLDYTAYRGTPLKNGVTQWLGMRYAMPPTGSLRFAAPKAIDASFGQQNSVTDAKQSGATCLPTNKVAPSKYFSEDCLNLDVYAPTRATGQSKLPVYVFIQGGGFNYNSNANYNGSGLILASKSNILVVTFNYRVGPYGFLASKEVAKGGSLNNGLKDQRLALKWVQKYISQFGGDPSQVTLGGDSAGGQSVTLHLTAYGGRDDRLFARTAVESQSFSALRNVSESQFAYDALVQRLKCDRSSDTLSCLRSIDATTLQNNNYNMPFPGATNAPLYMYGPVIDYDFVSDYTYRAYAQGKYLRLPAIYGDDTNEGTTFAPRATNSSAASSSFLHDQFPQLNNIQSYLINIYYPLSSTKQYPGAGQYWQQAAAAYGEMRYTCPGIFVSQAYASNGVAQNWNYRWNVRDQISETSGLGVYHTVEVNAIWGPENVRGSAPLSYQTGGSNNAIVPVVQGYWTSFIRSGDPNKYRAQGTPEWKAWTSNNAYARLKFETGSTGMEYVPDDQKKRCAFWSTIGVSLQQ